ncbi:MAG: cell division protein ZapA [SAR324 cluster bacterium]|nr:cell division protein ZapA [SAR324 cluster bacterium]
MSSETSGLKQYTLNINGHRFSVNSSYGEEHIRSVESFLNKRMLDINSQSETYGPTTLALLVSLNLADELLSLKNEKNHVKGEWLETIQTLCERLDKALLSR